MNRVVEREHISQIKRSRWITTLFFIVIFFFGTLFSLKGNTGAVTVQVDDASKMLGILGTYGDPCFIFADDVDGFWLTDSLDTGIMIEGEETKNTLSGLYRNDEFGEYSLHIYTDKTPFIVVQYGDGKTIVFNQGNKRLTNDIYEDLLGAFGE